MLCLLVCVWGGCYVLFGFWFGMRCWYVSGIGLWVCYVDSVALLVGGLIAFYLVWFTA